MTEETSIYQTNHENRVYRGGSCYDTSPVCYRSGQNSLSNTSANVGYRIVLYMK